MPVDVKRARREITAAERVWRALPREIRNATTRYQRSEINPIWREEIKAQPLTGLQGAVFKSGNSVKTGSALTLVAGNSNRKLSGGGTPNMLAAAAEYGSNRRDKYTRYNRKGRPVTRRTGRGLKEYRRSGYVATPAARKTTKRVTSLTVATIMKNIYKAAEGK